MAMTAKDKRAERRARPKVTVEESKAIEAMYHNTINAQDRLDYLHKFRRKTRRVENLSCFAGTSPAIICNTRCKIKIICRKTLEDIKKAKALITIEKKLLGGDPGDAAEAQLAEQQVEREAWTKEEILDRIAKRDDWACNALRFIYKNQTADEQSGEYTKETNYKGFSKYDAEFLTSLAKQLESKHWLSVKQLVVLRKRIPKYWRQLLEAANKGV